MINFDKNAKKAGGNGALSVLAGREWYTLGKAHGTSFALRFASGWGRDGKTC